MEGDGFDSRDNNKRVFGRAAVRLFVRGDGKEEKLREREIGSTCR